VWPGEQKGRIRGRIGPGFGPGNAGPEEDIRNVPLPQTDPDRISGPPKRSPNQARISRDDWFSHVRTLNYFPRQKFNGYP